MSRTHSRDGDKALLQYMVAKRHDEEGNAVYLLSGVFETVAGITDHREQAGSLDEEWVHQMRTWWGKCRLIGGGDSAVLQGLW